MAGKTNLLEAISMLSPGRGLRQAQLTQLNKTKQMPQMRVIPLKLNVSGLCLLRSSQMGFKQQLVLDAKQLLLMEKCKTSRKNKRGDCEVADLTKRSLVGFLLTPQMDRLFVEGGSQRRRFIDRLVFAFDALHSKRVNQYNHALRERKKLLQSWTQDTHVRRYRK